MAIGQFMPMVAGGGDVKAKITYLGQASTLSSGTSFNFGNFTAPTAGLLIVSVGGYAFTGGEVSSVLVGGSNATKHTGNPTGQMRKVAIASREVAAGSHTVSANMSADQSTVGGPVLAVFVYLLTDYKSSVPTDTGYTNASSATNVSVSVDIDKGGAAVFVASVGGASNTPMWSSATPSGNANSASNMAAGSWKLTNSLSLGHVETASWATTGSSAIAGVSWR